MKRAIDTNIGGVKFVMEEDAYSMLENYLTLFEKNIPDKQDAKEVMEDIEIRVVELFQKEIKFPNQVINEEIVQSVIKCLGEIDSPLDDAHETESNYETRSEPKSESRSEPIKKIYRDPEGKKIAGVCSGIANYFNIDVAIVRILFIAAIVVYGGPILGYIVLWIAMPNAITTAQKLEMRGIPVTAENIKNFTAEKDISPK